MTYRYFYPLLVAPLIFTLMAFLLYYANKRADNTINDPSPLSISSPATLFSPPPTGLPGSQPLAEPVARFRERVTKKPFGIYVSPRRSPVQSERFTGYHTGADAEYGDVSGDVPVYSIAPGRIIAARSASGYGGVVAIQHTIQDSPVIGIYGHLRPSSLPSVGAEVARGQSIGVLGAGFSQETNDERKHLHFALLNGIAVDLKGYVQNQNELSGWQDPLKILP